MTEILDKHNDDFVKNPENKDKPPFAAFIIVQKDPNEGPDDNFRHISEQQCAHRISAMSNIVPTLLRADTPITNKRKYAGVETCPKLGCNTYTLSGHNDDSCSLRITIEQQIAALRLQQEMYETISQAV